MMAAIVLGCGYFTLTQGAFHTSWSDFTRALADPESDTDVGFAVWELRMPRLILAVLVGGALGVAGAVMQAITRNPLADPGLTGVTAGAAFAVVLGFTLLHLPPSGLLALGTFGGIAAGTLTFALSLGRSVDPMRVILAGIAISAFFLSGINVLLLLGAGSMNGAWFWLIGGLSNRNWADVTHVATPLCVVGVLVWCACRRLDMMSFDDDTARGIGVALGRWRIGFGICAVVLAACCVTVSGPIGFIGLLAPHIARMTVGGGHVRIIPISALAGAAILSAADALAISRLVFPSQIPTGIPAILIGATAFLFLMQKERV